MTKIKILSALLFAVAVFAAVAASMGDVGLTWDEAIDARSARLARDWFGEAARGGSAAFDKEVVSSYWAHDWKGHPAVTRIVYAVMSNLFRAPGDDDRRREWISFRMCSAAIFSFFALSILFAGWKLFDSFSAGFASAIFFVCMPRVFGHAHIVGTDTILSFTAFLSVMAFIFGLRDRRGALLFGILAGALPAIKLTGVIAPLSALLYGAIFERGKIKRNLAALLIVSPIVFVVVQPMLWSNPAAGASEYFAHYLDPRLGSTITVSYFGRLYKKSPPWTYSLAMLMLTTPPAVLCMSVAGAVGMGAKTERRRTAILLSMCALIPALVVMLPGMPRYDSERLLLPSLPYFALLAGAGFQCLTSRLGKSGKALAMALVVLASVMAPARARPLYMSYFNTFIGGLPGAERRGLEVTYWGDAFTPRYAREINRQLKNLPPGTRLTTIGYFSENLRYFQELGYLDKKFAIVDYGGEADFLLLFNRRGVLDESSLYLLEHGLLVPGLAVKKDGVFIAGVYVLRSGYELMMKSAAGVR